MYSPSLRQTYKFQTITAEESLENVNKFRRNPMSRQFLNPAFESDYFEETDNNSFNCPTTEIKTYTVKRGSTNKCDSLLYRHLQEFHTMEDNEIIGWYFTIFEAFVGPLSIMPDKMGKERYPIKLTRDNFKLPITHDDENDEKYCPTKPLYTSAPRGRKCNVQPLTENIECIDSPHVTQGISMIFSLLTLCMLKDPNLDSFTQFLDSNIRHLNSALHLSSDVFPDIYENKMHVTCDRARFMFQWFEVNADVRGIVAKGITEIASTKDNNSHPWFSALRFLAYRMEFFDMGYVKLILKFIVHAKHPLMHLKILQREREMFNGLMDYLKTKGDMYPFVKLIHPHDWTFSSRSIPNLVYAAAWLNTQNQKCVRQRFGDHNVNPSMPHFMASISQLQNSGQDITAEMVEDFWGFTCDGTSSR